MRPANKNLLFRGFGISAYRVYVNMNIHPGYFEKCASEVGLEVEDAIIGTSWYEAEKGLALFQRAAYTLDMSLRDLTVDILRHNLTMDNKALYRFIRRFGGLHNILYKSPTIASAYANYYRYELLYNKKGDHSAKLTVPSHLAEWTMAIVEGMMKGIIDTYRMQLKSFRILSKTTVGNKPATNRAFVFRVRYS